MTSRAAKPVQQHPRRGQVFVRLPDWAAEELRKRVERGRQEDLDLTLSGLVRRMVLTALKADGVQPPALAAVD